MADNNKIMDKIISLAKQRGFIFQSSEIYGGLKSAYDYGPLGVELKRNIMNEWWRAMVHEREDITGLDASIIMHPKVWEASGHLAGFADPLVDWLISKERFRADKAPTPNVVDEIYITCNDKGQAKDYQVAIEKRFNISMKEYKQIRDYAIASVARNIKSNAGILTKSQYIFVYAPTYFSSIDYQSINEKPVYGIGHLIGQVDLPLEIYEKEMQLLEEDYRENLLKKLSLIPGITVLDYSASAKHVSWFLDYSHLNEFAAKSISYQLSLDLDSFLQEQQKGWRPTSFFLP